MMLATQTILCPICRAPNRGDARFCQQCGHDVVLDDIYRITKVVKEGGQGIVYKAIDETGAEYAVKEMHDRFATAAEREEGIEDFLAEGQMLANLRHPAIPRVFRSFIDEGRYYLSMEFIYGEDLEDRVKREQMLSEDTVLRWAGQICEVLQYMHSQGLIYRDMKPSNIMITRDGAVKMIDFGIAKLLQPGQRNTMIGTPGYAPPEQYQGLANAKSDIYALAATLHHLMTGRDPRDHPPFTFPPADEVNPTISRQTSDALEKALSMDEVSRFHTMEAFCTSLPIPQGDRRPTLPFNPEPPTRRPTREPVRTPSRSQPIPQPRPQPQPRQQLQPRPQSQSQPRQQPQPQRMPVVPPAAPARTAAPPQRSGGGFRRFLATLVLVGGLGGIGAAVFPAEAQALWQQLQQVVGGLTQGDTPVPAPSVPLAPLTTIEQTLDVEVQVPEGQTPSIDQFRDQFLAQVRLQYPGAEFLSSARPSYVGSIPQAYGSPENGVQRYRATMSGRVAIPSQ